jgi:hypothetical protein
MDLFLQTETAKERTDTSTQNAKNKQKNTFYLYKTIDLEI